MDFLRSMTLAPPKLSVTLEVQGLGFRDLGYAGIQRDCGILGFRVLVLGLKCLRLGFGDSAEFGS